MQYQAIWHSGFSKNISNDFFHAGRQLITQIARPFSKLITPKVACREGLWRQPH
jgi:hypothetical protein